MRSRDKLALFGALAIGGAAITACGDEAETSSTPLTLPCGSSANLSYESFAGPFFLDWCTGCHSSDLPEGRRQDAPSAVNLDSLEDIRQHRELILERAVRRADMPPAGGPSERERQLLAEWFECGALSETRGFDPGPASDAGGPPKPTGECAKPRQPLPDAVMPRCSAVTKACIELCPTQYDEDSAIEDCREACVNADLTPEAGGVSCSDCMFNEVLACASARGCADQTAFLYCCLENCVLSGAGAPCFQSSCADEIQAFGYCVGYGPTECASYTSGPRTRCFGP